jgi:hypothetical protein
MSKVEISRVTYGVYGNCVKLTNGLVELVASLDFGPRILHFSTCGKENMLYNDIAKKPLAEKFDEFGGDQLILYGGHRLWISPEIVPRCYHPDNVPVKCEEIENGIILYGAPEEKNQIQKIITVTLHPEKSAVNLRHEVKNLGLWDIELAPWCITMMDKGGKEIVPVTGRQTKYLPNRSITLWDYSCMNDSRVYWGKEFITITQDENMENAFKLGLNNEDGYAAYFNKGQVFLRYFEHEIDGFYPDNGCSYETYVNGVMVEMEVLGEMGVLMPGDSLTIDEDWELYAADVVPSNDEAQIKEVLSKYMDL